jgi:chromosome segregation ATPase
MDEGPILLPDHHSESAWDAWGQKVDAKILELCQRCYELGSSFSSIKDTLETQRASIEDVSRQLQADTLSLSTSLNFDHDTLLTLSDGCSHLRQELAQLQEGEQKFRSEMQGFVSEVTRGFFSTSEPWAPVG